MIKGPNAFHRRPFRVIAVAVVLALAGGLLADAAEDSLEGEQSVSRVAVVVMENHEYSRIIGNSHAPYINSLARRYALATRFYAVDHPSLPNYLAMLGGSTFGVDSDCWNCGVDKWNLVDQLEAHGISWRGYMEGLPNPCYRGGDTGRYSLHHNPFMYFDSIVDNDRRCGNVVPFRRLRTALDDGDRLPQFIWVTPDACHDMHDCSVERGDRFLSRWIPQLLDGLGPNGVLFLTFDEGDSDSGCCKYAEGGRVVTIVAGPGARQHVRSSVPYTTYSILRTIEDAWGLRRLRHAKCGCSRPLTALIRSG